ncbi:MAG: hypothetical protein QW250_01090, partial [Sulfolobaceae archaeon]
VIGEEEELMRRGYVRIGEFLVKKEIAEEIMGVDLSGKPISDLVKKYGGQITEVLDQLGYKVIWKDISDGIIVKRG